MTNNYNLYNKNSAYQKVINKDGSITFSMPEKTYTTEVRRGKIIRTDSYIPHVITFNKNRQVISQKRLQPYSSVRHSNTQKWGLYDPDTQMLKSSSSGRLTFIKKKGYEPKYYATDPKTGRKVRVDSPEKQSEKQSEKKHYEARQKQLKEEYKFLLEKSERIRDIKKYPYRLKLEGGRELKLTEKSAQKFMKAEKELQLYAKQNKYNQIQNKKDSTNKYQSLYYKDKKQDKNNSPLIYPYRKKNDSETIDVMTQVNLNFEKPKLEAWKEPEGYEGIIFNLRKKIEIKEIAKRREKIKSGGKSINLISPETSQDLSAVFYPFRSKEAVKDLTIKAGEGLLIGGALTALGSLTGGIGPAVLLSAGGVYGASQTPKIQDYFYKSKNQISLRRKETISQAGAETISSLGGAIAGSYLTGVAFPNAFNKYKTYKSNKEKIMARQRLKDAGFRIDKLKTVEVKSMINQKRQRVIIDNKLAEKVPDIQVQKLKDIQTTFGNKYNPLPKSGYLKTKTEPIIIKTKEGEFITTPEAYLESRNKIFIIPKREKLIVLKDPNAKPSSIQTKLIQNTGVSEFNYPKEIIHSKSILTKLIRSKKAQLGVSQSKFRYESNFNKEFNILKPQKTTISTESNNKINLIQKYPIAFFSLKYNEISDTDIKTINNYDYKTNLNIKPISEQKNITKSKENIIEVPKLEIYEVQKPISNPKINTEQISKQIDLIEESPAKDQIERIKTPTLPNINTPPNIKIPPRNPPRKTPPLPTLIKLPKFDNKKRISSNKETGYSLFVKSKGKYFKVNKESSLSKSNALSLGARLIEKSTSASFIIKKSGEFIKPSKKDNYFSRMKNQFYSRQEKKGLRIIEKSKYRINTKGEFIGITAKGLLSQKSRKKKKTKKMFKLI